MEDYKAVLFDLDGTLVDTAPDFVIAANALRAHKGLAPLPAEQIRPVVSNGSAAVTETALALSRDDQSFEANRQLLLDEYALVLGQQSQLFPSLDPLLAELESAGIPWGIVTNKPFAYTEPLIKALTLENRCGALICPDHVARAKPDPAGIILGVEHLARHSEPLETKQCLYVGDHLRDIEAGKAAGCDTVAVAYGYLASDDKPEDWNADYLAPSPEKLCTLLGTLLLP